MPKWFRVMHGGPGKRSDMAANSFSHSLLKEQWHEFPPAVQSERRSRRRRFIVGQSLVSGHPASAEGEGNVSVAVGFRAQKRRVIGANEDPIIVL